MRIKYDPQAKAAYIDIRPDLGVDKTIEVSENDMTVLVDLSKDGIVIGVEVLHLKAKPTLETY